MTAQRKHLYSLDFLNHPVYGSKQIQHVQNMGVQVCRILTRGSLIHRLISQLEPMKTICQRMPMARSERILKFLKTNDINAFLEPTRQAIKTWAEKRSVSKSKRLRDLLSRLETASNPVPAVAKKINKPKVRKVLLMAHIFGHDGAVMMIKKTACHWRHDLTWRFDDWHACPRSGSLLQKIRQE